MIQIQNLDKYYNKNRRNEIHVIDDISLELPNQGLVSFLGTSGSGKTTLLNVIGGLDKAKGVIKYDSFEMNKYSMSKIDKYRNENIGYVFQGYNLLLEETVFDNLKIALELIDIYDKNEVQCRIEYALKSVGMYKYRKKKARNLSGGQQQRVAIARALIKQCKIIIADEPTGNLDSANAIEVMNILKSISKTTLVLLVTHNKSFAEFYSDYIYKLEDGKIVDEYQSNNTSTLENTSENDIYLKDLSLTEKSINNVNVKIYSSSNKNIELEVIEKNGTYYIRSNKNIKLAENSGVELINDHFKPIIKQDIESTKFDNSFFNNSVKKKNIFNNLFFNLKKSLQNLKNISKKTKIFYFALFAIGIVFAICSISISNSTGSHTNNISVDNNYYLVRQENDGYYDDSELLKKALIAGDISSVQMVEQYDFSFKVQVNFVEYFSYSASYNMLYYNAKVNKIICGREPINGEIAISKNIADTLLAKHSDFFSTYEDLFALNINANQNIVGIVDNPYNFVYTSKLFYADRLPNHISVIDYGYRYYQYEKQYNTYEIIAGRDLNDSDFNSKNALIPDSFQNYEDYLGTEYREWMIVGVYHMEFPNEKIKEMIINQEYEYSNMISYKYSYETNDYALVEGRHPNNETECLISIYSDLKVGDFYEGYKIVGRYTASKRIIHPNALFSLSVLSIKGELNNVFLLEDEQHFKGYLDKELVLNTMGENVNNIIGRQNNEKIDSNLSTGIICLIISSIMIMFLMRSKMINDIYNIGVYRCLGASKKKIYLKYLFEIIVMVTCTALISYSIIIFGYLTSIDSINKFFGANLENKGLFIPLIGAAILYLMNILFGLLPIFVLLRKTPAEITAKYDI